MVDVQVVVYSMDSFREATMDYLMTIYLRQRWRDHRLAYNDYNDSDVPEPIQLDFVDMKDIWVPDTHFVNEKMGEFHTVTKPNKLLHVHRDGTVLYSMRLSLKLMCNMDLWNYPLDIQTCPIIMESYAHTNDSLILRWVESEEERVSIDTNQDENLRSKRAEFTLWNKTTGVNDQHYPPYGYFTILTANMTLRREIDYYIIQIYLPTILVVMLSWVSFWLHVEATAARISLGVLTILTFSTLMSSIRPTLPKVAYIKAMDVWMAVCVIFVFAALLEFAVVNMYTRGESIGKGMRKKLKLLRGKKDGPTIELQDHEPDTDSAIPLNSHPKTDIDSRLAHAQFIDSVARFLFPIVFVIFNLFYWIYYGSKRKLLELF